MKANENPFRSSNVERIRYALSSAELGQMADRALELRCSCLLGSHGTGKTTLLEDLEPQLQARGLNCHWLRLNLDASRDARRAAVDRLAELQASDICLFDGAEVLSRWQPFRLRRMARKQGFALIATLHRTSPLPVLHQTQADWQLAESLVRRLSEQHCSTQLIQQAQLAFQQSGGNVREVFRACYWHLAQGSVAET